MNSRSSARRIALACACAVAAAALAHGVDLQPVATVTQLMQAMVVPASNALFNLPRDPPDTEQGWAAARNSAVVLAESGNLLLLEGRAKDSGIWAETSRALTESGKAALEAALERDAEAIAEIGGQIIEACETCHEKHWIR